MKIASMMLALLFCTNYCNANEWVAYQGYQTQVVQTTNIQHQPVVVYQWVPVVVQQNIVVERRCFFMVNQRVVSQPSIQWIYQPVVIYR